MRMQKLILTFVIIIISITCAFAKPKVDSKVSTVAVEKEIASIDSLVALHPEKAELYYKRGMLHQKINEMEKAVSDYSMAINSDTTNLIYRFARAGAYREVNQYDMSLQDINNILKIDPNNGKAYHRRAYTYMLKGKWEESEADFEKAIGLEPTNVEYRVDYCLCFLNQGRYLYAFGEADKAVKINPLYSDAYNFRGRSNFGMKKFRQALEDFQTAARLDTCNELIYTSMAITYMNLSMTDSALYGITRALDCNPDYAEGFSTRASIRKNVGNIFGAIDDYAQSIDLNPYLIESYFNLGKLLYDRGDMERAFEYYNRAAEVFPQNPVVFFNRGKALFNRNRLIEALDDFSRVVELSKNDPDYIQLKQQAMQEMEIIKKKLEK
jgi:tetratricopeptide (TPR) repeat protein